MGRRSLVLAIALALAALAGFAVFQFLSGVEEDIRGDIEEVTVYRAVQFIDTGTPGESVNNIDFIIESRAPAEVVRDRPRILCLGPADGTADSVEPSICDANEKNLDNVLNGAVAAGPISAGQLITTDMFVTPVELNSASLSESIEEGKVAISINPSTVQAAGGFIRPGDRINLIASAEVDLGGLPAILADPTLREIFTGIPAEDPGPTIPGQDPTDPVGNFANSISTTIEFTQTFEQNIKVIAVGADTEAAPLGTGLTPQPDQIIVVEVTPEQAERIEFARQFTSVGVMLLPDPDENTYTPFDARGVVTDDVLDVLERIIEQLAEVESRLGT